MTFKRSLLYSDPVCISDGPILIGGFTAVSSIIHVTMLFCRPVRGIFRVKLVPSKQLEG